MKLAALLLALSNDDIKLHGDCRDVRFEDMCAIGCDENGIFDTHTRQPR